MVLAANNPTKVRFVDFNEVIINRFRDKATPGNPNECWIWPGYCNTRGYGYITHGGTSHYAHRISLFLAEGAPPEGYNTCMHSCDNPPCFNPAHLSWGTDRLNMLDSRNKKRLPCQKLVASQVAYIKLMLAHTITVAEIARCYCISKRLVRLIRNGDSWSDIEAAPLLPALAKNKPQGKKD
jgi:hypothetical protein